MGTAVLFWGQGGRVVKVTTHLHLVPMLRMRVRLLRLPLYAFVEGTETILQIPLLA
jgi:hypothetical protein